MTMLKFASHMLAKEYPKSIFYTITLIFQIAMTFIFFTIPNNQILAEEVQQGAGTLTTPFVAVLSFIIITFCCCMIIFASNFYVSKKNKEFAVYTLSGWTALKITQYVLSQIGILMLIAVPAGLFLGYGAAVLANHVMYQQAGILASPFYVPLAALVQTLAILCLMLLLIIMVAGCYVYRNEIRDFLSQSRQMQPRPGSTLKRTCLYFFLYLLGLFLTTLNDYGDPYYFQILMGMFGAGGLVIGGIPYVIGCLKRFKWMSCRYSLIAASHLNYTLQKNVILASCVVVSVTALVGMMIMERDNPRLLSIIIIGYGVVVILLVTSIIYNLCHDIQQRPKIYYNLWRIGYTKKELRLIIRREILGFYLILTILPLLYMGAIGWRYVGNGSMGLAILAAMLLAYLIPIFLSALVVYRTYIKMVVEPIKGEV